MNVGSHSRALRKRAFFRRRLLSRHHFAHYVHLFKKCLIKTNNWTERRYLLDPSYRILCQLGSHHYHKADNNKQTLTLSFTVTISALSLAPTTLYLTWYENSSHQIVRCNDATRKEFKNLDWVKCSMDWKSQSIKSSYKTFPFSLCQDDDDDGDGDCKNGEHVATTDFSCNVNPADSEQIACIELCPSNEIKQEYTNYGLDSITCTHLFSREIRR